MTLQRLTYIATEATLTGLAIAHMLAQIAWCAITRHDDLDWQHMSNGVVGKCRRCGATVEP